MELKNTSYIPNHTLRAMIRWCCKQVGYPYNRISEARFRHRNPSSPAGKWGSGRAWLRSRRILVNVPREDNLDGSVFSATNATVEITAHEIAHLYVYWKYGSVSEAEVREQGKLIVDDFAVNKDALLAAWAKEPAKRESKPKPAAAEKREGSNRALLKKWESKLKAAQNKVKKYRAKVRYYDRKRAAKEAE
ncbi:hypothetical protein LCGC14_1018490 [marine sediment metagenome]|uniref:SprT-like domain-containing protein n=1 Tax=marine sediment metagenome TaxID=412755 RepID=A0A0F9NJR1_9ZZZZ